MMKKFLLIIALAAAIVIPAAADPDLSGYYITRINSGNYDLVLNIIPANGQAGDCEYGFVMGYFPVPNQQIDWLTYMPAPVYFSKGDYCFTSIIDSSAESYEFELALQGQDLVGRAIAETGWLNVTFERSSQDEIYDIANGRGKHASSDPGIAALGLDKKYRNACSDPGIKTSFGYFSDAYLEGGRNILIFEEEDGVFFYLIDKYDRALKRMFMPDGENPAEPFIQEPYVIRYHESTYRNPAGKKIDIRVPNEIIGYDREAFEDYGIRNALNLYTFLDQLAALVADGDLSPIAGIIDYPLTLQDPESGKSFTYNSPDEVLAISDHIFNGKIKNAILNQSFEDLFINYNGLMIGSGELWFAITRGDEFLLTTINPF